jgi:hypothetical protein
MGTISRLIANTQKVSMQGVLEDSFDATKKEMIRLQKDQLLHGERADGKKIGKYRSPSYAKKKHAQNPLAGYGNMDWKLTGELHKEIFADVRENSVVLDSADPKTGKLIEAHGDPFGLTEKNSGAYAKDILAPEAVRRIRNQILK